MSSRSGGTSSGALLGGIGRGFAGSLGLLGVRSLVGIGLLSLGGISGVLLGIGLLSAIRLKASCGGGGRRQRRRRRRRRLREETGLLRLDISFSK